MSAADGLRRKTLTEAKRRTDTELQKTTAREFVHDRAIVVGVDAGVRCCLTSMPTAATFDPAEPMESRGAGLSVETHNSRTWRESGFPSHAAIGKMLDDPVARQGHAVRFRFKKRPAPPRWIRNSATERGTPSFGNVVVGSRRDLSRYAKPCATGRAQKCKSTT